MGVKKFLGVCLGVTAASALTGQGHAQSDPTETPPPYRALPIARLPYFHQFTSGFGAFPRWPSRYDYGTAMRSRFFGEVRIAATLLVETEPDQFRRRGAVVSLDEQTGWTLKKLPMPHGAIESIVTDANSDGIVVGACVFPELDFESNPRIVACYWTIAGGDALNSSVTLLVPPSIGAGCETGQFWESSALFAVGKRFSDGVFPFAGAVKPITDHPFVDGFIGRCQPGTTDEIHRLFDSGVCGTTPLPCDDEMIARRIGAVGAPTPSGVRAFGSEICIGGMGLRNGCAQQPPWAATRWSFDGSSVIRQPFVCGDPTPDAPSQLIQLIPGVYGLERRNHVSSIWDSPQPEVVQSLAGGAIEFELSTDVDGNGELWCDSHTCTKSHASVFMNPYGEGFEIIALDLHFTVPGAATSQFPQSSVSRVGPAPATGGDWIAVGARSREGFLESENGEGVIWLGKLDEGDFQWCGRSMNDPATVLTSFGARTGFDAGQVQVVSVHDVQSSGIAIGFGSISGDNSAHADCLVLLTELSDINGYLQVDGSDLGSLLAAWGSRGANPELDLNGDGVVNGGDLTIMLSGWGWGIQGRAAAIRGICEDRWTTVEPLPIQTAVTALGFMDVDAYGDYAALLPQDSAVSLCCFVVDIARSLTNP